MENDLPPTPTPLRPSIADPDLELRRRKRSARRAAMRWGKRGALIALVAGIVGGLAYAWLPKPVDVDVAAARRETLRIQVEEDGRTRVHDRYQVLAPTGGTLERVELRAGDAVRAGAVVARVRPPAPTMLDERTRADAEARLAAARSRAAQARSGVARAQAARAQAARDVDRARALRDVATAAEVERAELADRVAAADLASAEDGARIAAADVVAAQVMLGQLAGKTGDAIAVTAPAAGQVLRVLRDGEGPIAAGTPLVEIGDPRAIEVVVDVLSSDAVRVVAGAPVLIDRWGGQTLRGEVARVEPSAFTRISALGVEEQRVNVIVSMIDPPPALGDGFRVEARIQVWEGEDVLVVPASAVFRDGGGWAVYAVAGGRARIRRVELGERGRLDVQVTGGLGEGAEVVLYPGEQVREGVTVRARRVTR
jgi:HlyD family secretion protein